MSKRTIILLVTILIAAALGGMSCSAGNDDSSGTGGASSGSNNNSTATNNNVGGGFETGGGNQPGQQIVITPSTFELTITDGAIVTQALTATMNGQDVTSQVQWSFEKPLVGDVSAAVFTPTGNAGGSGLVQATLGNASGTATGTVYIKKTVGVGLVTPEQKMSLDAPTGGADPALQMLYPYDQTVFPLDVLAPEIMWNGGQFADVYKLTIVEKYYEYTEYLSAAPPSRHLIAETDWKAIAESGSGSQSDPVAVSVTRWSNGTAYSPDVRTWRIAQGRLKGVVYYWELPDQCGSGNGRVLRIKPSSPTPEEFYQPGGCWGCHTVSRDGKKMMATLDSGTPFPQITIDLTNDPAVPGSITAASGLGGTFSAFNNDGTKIVTSSDGTFGGVNQLRIVDSTTGQILNPNAMGSGCAEPAWSPDGLKMAAVCGTTSDWVFDSYGGFLSISDVAPDGVTVSPPTVIVPQGAPGRPAYPSFTPDSQWLAFGRPTAGSRSTGNGSLWLTNVTGSEVKQLFNLDSANGTPDGRSFNPVFAPLRAGGYYWLVFISRRDYGNRLVGSNRQQLWVGAITDPPAAADPSQPAFYLRGQEDCGKSENAYFALEPCKQIGEPCTSGVDCCEGTCVKDPNSMEYVCGTPEDCAQDGNACDTDADCCDAPTSTCIDGFCQKPVPQ